MVKVSDTPSTGYCMDVSFLILVKKLDPFHVLLFSYGEFGDMYVTDK